jgi:hypothetical protein
VKRPNSFRPIVAGLEARSLLSGLTSVSHPAVEVHVLRTKVSKHLPPTTTTMTSSTSHSNYGATVTFTATIQARKRNAGNPTGTVAFKDGNTVLGSVPVSIKKRIGTASFRTSILGPGNHAIVATYSGNKRLATSSNATPVGLQVSRVSSTLTLTSPGSSTFGGGPVTFTAKVAPAVTNLGLPTGTVTFTEGGNVLAAGVQVVNGVAQAALNTSSLSTGTHAIVATYSGDGNFNPNNNGSSPRTLQVVPAAISLSLTNSTTSVVVGDQISFTATVIPTGSPPSLPTGTVAFTSDINPNPTVIPLQVVNGFPQAVYTFTAPAHVGFHVVSAIYSGDSNFLSNHS